MISKDGDSQHRLVWRFRGPGRQQVRSVSQNRLRARLNSDGLLVTTILPKEPNRLYSLRDGLREPPLDLPEGLRRLAKKSHKGA